MIAVAALHAKQRVADALRIQWLVAALNLRRQSLQNSTHFGILAAAALQAVQRITDVLSFKRLTTLRSQYRLRVRAS